MPTPPRRRLFILDDWEGVWAQSAQAAALREWADVTIAGQPVEPANLPATLATAEVLVLNRERTPLSGETLRALPELKAIFNTGTGMNHLDLDAASSLGIHVSNSPGLSASSVAEQTFALLLAALKRVPQLQERVLRGDHRQILVPELNGRRLGVVGLGKIGTAVARLGQAFGMTVSAWSPHLSAEHALETGVDPAESKYDLAERSDVLSVHLRLGAATRGIIDDQLIGKLPRGAVFVNTSRAQLVDEPALVARASAGELLLALDVWGDAVERELASLPGAFSPHMGWMTEETWRRFLEATTGSILSYLREPADAQP